MPDIIGNIVYNERGDSLTIHINEDVNLTEGTKLFCYRNKDKKEDRYGRPIYDITTTQKDYSKYIKGEPSEAQETGTQCVEQKESDDPFF